MSQQHACWSSSWDPLWLRISATRPLRKQWRPAWRVSGLCHSPGKAAAAVSGPLGRSRRPTARSHSVRKPRRRPGSVWWARLRRAGRRALWRARRKRPRVRRNLCQSPTKGCSLPCRTSLQHQGRSWRRTSAWSACPSVCRSPAFARKGEGAVAVQRARMRGAGAHPGARSRLISGRWPADGRGHGALRAAGEDCRVQGPPLPREC